MISISELKRFYTTELSFDELAEIASKLDEVALQMPNFDEEDHDVGKDAGHFHWAYLEALRAKANGVQIWLVSHFVAPETYLVWAIDVLIHGCHAETSPVSSYVKGGTIELLEELAYQ